MKKALLFAIANLFIINVQATDKLTAPAPADHKTVAPLLDVSEENYVSMLYNMLKYRDSHFVTSMSLETKQKIASQGCNYSKKTPCNYSLNVQCNGIKAPVLVVDQSGPSHYSDHAINKNYIFPHSLHKIDGLQWYAHVSDAGVAFANC